MPAREAFRNAGLPSKKSTLYGSINGSVHQEDKETSESTFKSCKHSEKTRTSIMYTQLGKKKKSPFSIKRGEWKSCVLHRSADSTMPKMLLQLLSHTHNTNTSRKTGFFSSLVFPPRITHSALLHRSSAHLNPPMLP